MSVLAGFVGPSNREASRNVDAERTINWFPEQIVSGTPKVAWSLPGTPGLSLAYSLYAGPVRALWAMNGRCFAIGGTVLHELFAQGTVTIRGSVALDANPATISTNGTGGNQLLITSGGHRYVYDLTTNTLTEITDDIITSPAVAGAFFDGFFLVLDTDGAFWWSTLEDGTTWNGLDFALESQFADTVVMFTVTHDNIWLYGTEHVGPWYNTGAATTTFAPIQGSIMQVGTAAPWSAANIFNTAIWVGQNADGTGIVYLAEGYQPTRISTHALEYALSTVSADQLYSSLGFTYQDGGHTFYLLQVPGLNTTWCYDLASKSWHERAIWSVPLMDWRRWLAQNHTRAFGKHLVGDRQSRGVYEVSASYLQDFIVFDPYV